MTYEPLKPAEQDDKGNYYFLRDLIDKTLVEAAWGSLGPNIKSALPRLKDIGDKSAHSRRYNAHREDIDNVAIEFRDCCQEFLSIAGLK